MPVKFTLGYETFPEGDAEISAAFRQLAADGMEIYIGTGRRDPPPGDIVTKTEYIFV